MQTNLRPHCRPPESELAFNTIHGRCVCMLMSEGPSSLARASPAVLSHTTVSTQCRLVIVIFIYVSHAHSLRSQIKYYVSLCSTWIPLPPQHLEHLAFPIAAVTNYHKCSDLIEQTFILLHFRRSEIKMSFKMLKWGYQQGWFLLEAPGGICPLSPETLGTWLHCSNVASISPNLLHPPWPSWLPLIMTLVITMGPPGPSRLISSFQDP